MQNSNRTEELLEKARLNDMNAIDFVEEEFFKAFDSSYESYRSGEDEQVSNIALYERSLDTITQISRVEQALSEDELRRLHDINDVELTNLSISELPNEAVSAVDNVSDDELRFVDEEIFKSYDKTNELVRDNVDAEEELALYARALYVVEAVKNLRQLLVHQQIQQAKKIQDMLRDE